MKRERTITIIIVLIVAPRTGAWIETAIPKKPALPGGSPPARGRGLKHAEAANEPDRERRPPHGGVD